MNYQYLKYLHMGVVTLSVSGFMLRSFWMLYRPELLKRGWVRIAPHFIDTLLFATGLGLAISAGISPGAHPWFAAKLVAIVLYILAGMVALRMGYSKATRITALCIALGAAAWAAGSALSHQPIPWGGM